MHARTSAFFIGSAVFFQAENYHRQALGQRRRAGANGPNDLAPFCYNLALVVGTNARKGPIEKLEQGEQEVKKKKKKKVELVRCRLNHFFVHTVHNTSTEKCLFINVLLC